MNEFINDEQAVVEEREQAREEDILALQRPISELHDLHPVVSISPDATVRSAIDLMVSKRVGCLLITDDGQLTGMFSERDVLRKVAASGVDIETTPVSDLMTKNPDTLPIDIALVFALQRMSVGGFRHVPLLDREGVPVSVVSMRDIVEHIVALYPNQILNLPEQPGTWSGRDGG